MFPLSPLPSLHPCAASDYMSGLPVREILREYGYCEHSFYRLLELNNVPRRRAPAKTCARCGDTHSRASAHCSNYCARGQVPKQAIDLRAKRISYAQRSGYALTVIAEGLGVPLHKITWLRKNFCGCCGHRFIMGNGSKLCPRGCV